MMKNDSTKMFYGAPNFIFENARLLRNNLTEAENVLWNILKGYKFRRQHPIDRFIVDFYCHKLKLVIEIDGGYHNSEKQQILVKDRTDVLVSHQLSVVRFTNEQVLLDTASVINQINSYLKLNNE